MKIILGNPGSGKTKRILQLSEENNIPILCESQARQERLLVKARGYGFSIPQPIVYNEVTEDVKEVYVDDVKKLLEVMFNVNVSCITVNVEDKNDLERM